jgi:hypothetical protein
MASINSRKYGVKPLASREGLNYVAVEFPNRGVWRCVNIVGLAMMAGVAQLVRAPVCGTGGRRFETGHSPHFPII